MDGGAITGGMTDVGAMDTATIWAELLELGARVERESGLGGGSAAEQPAPDDPDGRSFALICVLQERGEPEVVDLALPLLAHPDPWFRQSAAFLLGHLGYPRGRPYEALALPALLDALVIESDDLTRDFLVTAVGQGESRAAALALIDVAGDPDPNIRHCAARFLTGDFDAATNSRIVDVLIELTGDPADDVRDGATFTLGSLRSEDGEPIREALWRRTTDAHGDTRAEAIGGLARRRDARAIPLMADLLEFEEVLVHLLDDAALLRAPALVEPLRLWDPTDPAVGRALTECDPELRSHRDALAEVVLEGVHRLRPTWHLALFSDRFEVGLTLQVSEQPITDVSTAWSVAGLLKRAGNDPAVAAELVVADITGR